MAMMPRSPMMPRSTQQGRPASRNLSGMPKPSYVPNGRVVTSDGRGGIASGAKSKWDQDSMYPASGPGAVDDNDYSGREGNAQLK